MVHLVRVDFTGLVKVAVTGQYRTDLVKVDFTGQNRINLVRVDVTGQNRYRGQNRTYLVT